MLLHLSYHRRGVKRHSEAQGNPIYVALKATVDGLAAAKPSQLSAVPLSTRFQQLNKEKQDRLVNIAKTEGSADWAVALLYDQYNVSYSSFTYSILPELQVPKAAIRAAAESKTETPMLAVPAGPKHSGGMRAPDLR